MDKLHSEIKWTSEQQEGFRKVCGMYKSCSSSITYSGLTLILNVGNQRTGDGEERNPSVARKIEGCH